MWTFESMNWTITEIRVSVGFLCSCCFVFVFGGFGGLFVCFWLCHTACGILVPQPGIEPKPSALKVQSLNHQGSPQRSVRMGTAFIWLILVSPPPVLHLHKEISQLFVE